MALQESMASNSPALLKMEHLIHACLRRVPAHVLESEIFMHDISVLVQNNVWFHA